MCAPDNIETRRVVIAGAGPSGLLLQALLHNRNKSPNARVMYDVTLIESRSDLGQLDSEELKAHRSWMIVSFLLLLHYIGLYHIIIYGILLVLKYSGTSCS